MVKQSGSQKLSTESVRDSLLITASLVIIIAGARLSADVLSPFLLALFIAVICGTPINTLARRGLPTWLASALVGLGIATVLFAVVVLLSSASDEFIAALPQYQVQFHALLERWLGWLANQGLPINQDSLTGVLDPAAAVGFFGNFLSGLGDTLGNVMLILFTVIFLIADASSFPKKLLMSSGAKAEKSLAALQELARAMNGYIATKTMVSLLTGFLIWLGLVLLDVPFAVLWGFLAFLLNFIPNIGSALAAIPAILLSLLEADPILSGMIITLYLGVNTLIGSVIEPAVMGQRVGLSTLAVFLSLVFWGWMFGAVGMLLSVPLTMVLKFITQQHEGTAWLALLVSNIPAQKTEAPNTP